MKKGKGGMQKKATRFVLVECKRERENEKSVSERAFMRKWKQRRRRTWKTSPCHFALVSSAWVPRLPRRWRARRPGLQKPALAKPCSNSGHPRPDERKRASSVAIAIAAVATFATVSWRHQRQCSVSTWPSVSARPARAWKTGALQSNPAASVTWLVCQSRWQALLAVH